MRWRSLPRWLSSIMNSEITRIESVISGADFGITYMASMAEQLGLLAPWPTLGAYVERNKARPAFQRALERGVE